MRPAILLLTLAALSAPAAAQRTRAQPATPPAAATSTAAPPGEPQRTTASFDEWTLRCLRPEKAPPLCEVSQVVSNKAQQPVAQTAIGRPSKAERLRLTMLVPVNVQLAQQPKLVFGDADPGVELVWRRCLPNGCVADAALSDEQLRKLRAQTETGRIQFLDAAGQPSAVPFSPHGLPAALDALAKE